MRKHDFFFLLFFFTIFVTIHSSHLIPYHVIIEPTGVHNVILTFICQHGIHIDITFIVLFKSRFFIQLLIPTPNCLRVFVIYNTMLKFIFHTSDTSCTSFVMIFAMNIFFHVHFYNFASIECIKRFRWSEQLFLNRIIFVLVSICF
jgi:hypothetical protein